MKQLRVAVAQPFTKLGDVEGNLEQVRDLARQAAAVGSRVMLTPEASLYGYSIPATVLDQATTADGPVGDALLEIAQAEDLVVIAGVYERDTQSDDIYISQFIARPSGELIVQRKAGGHERPGIARPPFEIKAFEVDAVRCAVVICIDSVRPNILADLVDAGCQVQLTPTAGGGAYGRYHTSDWDDRAKYEEYEKAMENSCYPGGGGMWTRNAIRMAICCSNLATGDDGADYFQQGHSYIVDSDGALLALIPGTHVQEHFRPKIAWADVTPRTPQHLPPDPMYPPPGTPSK